MRAALPPARLASRLACGLGIGLAILVIGADRPSAADKVKITLPAAVSFDVRNVSVSTVGSPNPSSISFTGLSVANPNVLRISVKADADFTPPSGTAIPASKISWTTSSPSHGVGSNGTLSKTAYTTLFQVDTTGRANGSVDVTWTLAAPGTGIRAGAHQLTMRWKLEAVAP